MDDTERRLLTDYLKLPPPDDPTRVSKCSCLGLALRDARRVTGRDDLGAIRRPEDVGTWAGAIVYLCVLDQLGSAVRREGLDSEREGRLREKQNSFKRCLVQFSQLGDDEINALWALRNAFAHNFSLVSKDVRLRGTWHLFSLSVAGAQLVRLPPHRWDGTIGDVAATTIVSLVGVGDLAEAVCRDVRIAHEAGQLRLALSDEEFRLRYFLMFGDPEQSQYRDILMR